MWRLPFSKNINIELELKARVVLAWMADYLVTLLHEKGHDFGVHLSTMARLALLGAVIPCILIIYICGYEYT